MSDFVYKFNWGFGSTMPFIVVTLLPVIVRHFEY